MGRFWSTATTVSTVPIVTHNTALSPASRAPKRGRSVRGYPTRVPDPLSRRGHAIWRFLPRRAAGRCAAYDLSDDIGADSCLSAFHWLRYFLGQPRLRKRFRGGPRGARYGRFEGSNFRTVKLLRIACTLARPPRLWSPGYGLSNALSRANCACHGAELGGCKAPTAPALR